MTWNSYPAQALEHCLLLIMCQVKTSWGEVHIFHSVYPQGRYLLLSSWLPCLDVTSRYSLSWLICPKGAQLCYQTHYSSGAYHWLHGGLIRPIQQVFVQHGLFLKWYAIDSCLISVSLLPIFRHLPISDLDGPNHFKNIVPVLFYWSRMYDKHTIKNIVELITLVPMHFH